MESIGILLGIGLAISFICALVIFILAVPEKRYQNAGKFGKFVSNVFNFRVLLIEGIFKFMYIFMTIYIIFFGIVAMSRNILIGLGIAVLGPIAIRLVFEFFMLTILLTKNVISINKKLLDMTSETPKMPGFPNPYPPARDFVQPGEMRNTPPKPGKVPMPDTCEHNQEQTNNSCPKCGNIVDKNMAFCKTCGNKLK